jgi:hypothetical protein
MCNRGERPKTDKHLPPNPFTGKFLRKGDLYGFGLLIVILSMLFTHF